MKCTIYISEPLPESDAIVTGEPIKDDSNSTKVDAEKNSDTGSSDFRNKLKPSFS